VLVINFCIIIIITKSVQSFPR